MIWDISDTSVGIDDLTFSDKCLVVSKTEHGNVGLTVEVRKHAKLVVPVELAPTIIPLLRVGVEQPIPASVLNDSVLTNIERVGETSESTRFSFRIVRTEGISVTVRNVDLEQVFRKLFLVT